MMSLPVQFDFEGSLQLARQLWAAADVVADRMAGLEPAADAALGDWTGPMRDRAGSEWSSYLETADPLQTGLRAAAESWATAWAAAMERVNEYRRSDVVEEMVRRHRDDLDTLPTVPDAVRPPVPLAPHFTATATSQQF